MEKINSFRSKRREAWMHIFPSGDIFFAGLIMAGIFFLTSSTYYRTLQFLLFWFYAWVSGKKTNPLITAAVMAGIVLFNLLIPYGKVLLHCGPFTITQGALISGIHKAVTLEGLIMLSKATIRKDLALPGTFGALIGDSFRILDSITERRGILKKGNLIAGIDQLMIALSEEPDKNAQDHQESIKRSYKGLILVCVMAASPLAVFLLPG